MMSRILGSLLQMWFFVIAPFQRNTLTGTKRSIHQIDFVSLKERGISLAIFDLDDTLTSWRADIPQDVIIFLNSLHNDIGMSVAILTNRCENIKGVHNIDHITIIQNPTKPLTGGFTKIFTHHNIIAEKTVMIGDRIATDMWGAKRAGIKTRILVEPYSKHMQNSSSPFIHNVARSLEKILSGHFFFVMSDNRRKRKQNNKT